MHLNRRFTPLNMLFLSINGMVGSAWLFAPLYAAKIAGPSAMVAWVLGGIATILIALTFAELSTFLPIAGGTTRFSQLSHGTFTGFIISWISWLSSVTMPPIEVQAVLQYSAIYFPSLTHLVNGKHALSQVGLLWATLIMFILCFINIASFTGFVRFNFLLFFFKIMVILLTIFMLITTGFHPQNFSGMTNHFSLSKWEATLSAVATAGIAFAFTGFKHGVELAGEAKRAQITIPLAIIGSVIICLLLYLGLQIAFLGAIHPDLIKQQGWHALSFSGDAGPFVGIALLLGLVWLAKLLYIDAAVSPLGAGFIYVTSTARLIYAMSKNGYLPSFLAKLNRQQLPIMAIIFNFVIGMFLFLPLPGWQTMVSFLVSAVVISYAMGPISLICLRRQLPAEKRPFRLPWAELLCLIAFYCCNLMSYWTGWGTISKLAIAIGIGMFLLLISSFRGSLKPENLGLKAAGWIIPYLIGLVVISYLGSFGGKQVIPFGWDFALIAIFSIFIFYMAIALRCSDIVQQFRAYQLSEVAEAE